ncbi:RagB/SusD family nutrient uptake outer membrane protein [Proteiniphilum sp. X52]|uniref:RagB/SusD family nutrient uptake outer membrane protein n=1 Tax=Proteiniphilum sp. X52 TaxID=2382159 RepID=UPI000F0A20B1|nr:RagB/SusD family nutrient uptake outer membrane protein [Proteiniphilum sp. X52]RNC65939.1 RagB/SusD family nutrient uptake outer membrane protein [Proteiniphilum sp. X52]
MKTKITIILIAVLSFICTNCTKLHDTSYSLIISEQFEPTSEDLASIVGTTYVNWRQGLLFWNSILRIMEVSSDQSVIPARPNGWVDGGVHRLIFEHQWSTDHEVVENCWNHLYAGVNNCNRVLFQIESGSIPVTEGKEETIAELKVLRASYYYMLCDLYGNVPIMTKYDIPEGFIPEQSTRQDVFDFVIKEVTENMPLLSEEKGGIMYGRFNQWAAWALLAKMYLNAEVYTGTSHWQECVEACDKVIESGLFELDANQRDVFATNNENAKEIILALPFDDQYVTDWNAFDIHMQTLQPANQATYKLASSPWGGICAVPQFIDTFDPDDIRLKENWIQGDQYSAEGDMLLCTMGNLSGQPLSYINEVPSIASSEEIHGFRHGKFEIAIGARVQLSNDWPLFRYADVLMMKAESLLRTGSRNEAAEIVTRVRERNFKATPEKAVVTGDQLLQGSVYDYGRRDDLVPHTFEGGGDVPFGRMLDELGWEFNQEGRRRQDMIRFGVYTRKSWFSHSPNGDYHSILPIPRSQLEKNANLKQNPGY